MGVTVRSESALSRRDYLRALVAAGGTAALSACLGFGDDDNEVSVPTGVENPRSLPDRQHAWNDVLSRDEDSNIQLPEHHVLVALQLVTDVDDQAREQTEQALRELERAYEWSNEGLVFTIGYTPAYFGRFDAPPTGIDLPDPEPLAPRESPALDEFDALVHLASDSPAVVLEAEEGLFGEREQLNGRESEADLTGIFERVEENRRTGFVGDGLVAEQMDLDAVPDGIPEDAPFFMGFRSGFLESQASESFVTIADGPFAGGTTQHLSSMDTNLTQWFEQENQFQRVSKLFSPEHAERDLVGDIGEKLGQSNALASEWIEDIEAVARERGVVGHAQKTARARKEGQPLLLRRDFNTVDGDQPGLHFLSLQRDVSDFVRVRDAMNGEQFDVPRANNGILHYLFVNRRGNYLIPPRSLRALPPADPS